MRFPFELDLSQWLPGPPAKGHGFSAGHAVSDPRGDRGIASSASRLMSSAADVALSWKSLPAFCD